MQAAGVDVGRADLRVVVIDVEQLAVDERRRLNTDLERKLGEAEQRVHRANDQWSIEAELARLLRAERARLERKINGSG